MVYDLLLLQVGRRLMREREEMQRARESEDGR
jgi:hypothetical protein